ncbi:MAG: tetratricopeptide repeat protein [Candidatus Kariarchaeaceae archaeon]|jgi:tetratricopeptide (TPR) repeat protein
MNSDISDELDLIENYFHQGLYERAIKHLNSVYSHAEGKDKIALDLRKIELLRYKGKYNEAILLAKNCIQDASICEVLQLKAQVEYAYTSWRMGLFKEANKTLDKAEESLIVVENQDLTDIKATILNIKGLIALNLGNLDKSKNYFNESLDLRINLGKSYDVAITMNNLGVVYLHQGKLNQALDYFNSCIDHLQEYGNKIHVAHAYNNIGLIYYNKGQLEISLDYHNKSLDIWRTLENEHDIAYSLFNIGLIHHDLGRLEISLEHLEYAYVIWQQYGNPVEITDVLFELLRITLKINDIDRSEEFFQAIEKINSQEENNLINLRFDLAKALMLKKVKRLKQQLASEEILVNLVNDEIIDHRLTIIAMKHLCEFYLIELKIYGEEHSFNKANQLVIKLIELGQINQSFSIFINGLVLKSKLLLLEGDLKTSYILLEQAEINAKEYSLSLLENRVMIEKKEFLKELNNWKLLLESNSTITDKIQKSKIIEYLMEIKDITTS